jgi:hypothetical protein
LYSLSVKVETNLLSLINSWLDKFCQITTKVLQEYFLQIFHIWTQPESLGRASTPLDWKMYQQHLLPQSTKPHTWSFYLYQWKRKARKRPFVAFSSFHAQFRKCLAATASQWCLDFVLVLWWLLRRPERSCHSYPSWIRLIFFGKFIVG